MRFLLLNQTFYPDVVATAQYLADVARALVARGHQVTVISGRRAYDNPDKTFPAREIWNGIEIRRVRGTRFGKGSKLRRAADFASFMVACCWQLLFVPRPDVVVALTSPPLISFIAACYAAVRRCRFVYWVMDLNPDEAIAAGWLRESSFVTWLLHGLSLFSLRRANVIIALDRFMQDRILRKGIAVEKVSVLPPWSHDEAVRFDAAAREEFRREYGLTGKFVVMYSGNHSPCHPLDSLLEAARILDQESRNFSPLRIDRGESDATLSARCAGRGAGGEVGEVSLPPSDLGVSTPGSTLPSPSPQPISDLRSPTSGSAPSSQLVTPRCSDITFCFIGGGSEFAKVQRFAVEHELTNILCLPYQPLERLAGSLSAADVHVVVMGRNFVGTIHPCKIYNVMRVAPAILYIGPAPGHIADIRGKANASAFAAVPNGDAVGIVKIIQQWCESTLVPETFRPLAEPFSQHQLLPRFISLLESLTP